MTDDNAQAIAREIGEMRGEMRGLRSAQESMGRDVRTIQAHVSTLVSSYQQHSLRLGQIDQRCEDRHRKDTDETEAARGVAARVEVVERRLDDIEPRFDETETSVVRATAGQEAIEKVRKETARRWQMVATVLSVLSAAAGLGIFKLLAGCGG